MAIKLIVFGARALQGTTLHLWLDEIRAAGIEMAVIGPSWDSREVQNTALILNSVYVGEDEEGSPNGRIVILRDFRFKLGLKETEMMIVSIAEDDHMAARVLHTLYSTPLGLEMLFERAGSVAKGLEFFS